MKHANTRLSPLENLAIEAIRSLITDPNTPASVRLSAAKMIVESAAAIEDEEDGGLDPDPKPAAQTLTLKAPPKIGRNDYCPCRSGLKYKKCCLGKLPRAVVPRANGPRPLPPAREEPPPTVVA